MLERVDEGVNIVGKLPTKSQSALAIEGFWKDSILIGIEDTTKNVATNNLDQEDMHSWSTEQKDPPGCKYCW